MFQMKTDPPLPDLSAEQRKWVNRVLRLGLPVSYNCFQRRYARFCTCWEVFRREHAEVQLPPAREYLDFYWNSRNSLPMSVVLIRQAVKEARSQAASANARKGTPVRWKQNLS